MIALTGLQATSYVSIDPSYDYSGIKRGSDNQRLANDGIATVQAKPKPIGNILAELLARRGYAPRASGRYLRRRLEASGRRHARRSARGPGRCGAACWKCWVSNSTLVQELSFEKTRLLENWPN